MNQRPDYGTVATRVAALQQRLNGVASGEWRVAGAKVASPLAHAPSPVTLIAASKTQSADVLEEAIAAGITDFGENKIQEAAGKWPALKAKYPQLRLHLIGALQSNKVAEAVALFDVIQTIDRPKIAQLVASQMQKQGKSPVLLIQVNIGEEAQKAGVAPHELPALLTECRALGLQIAGLMAVPPAESNPAPYFALMQKLARRHGLGELSIGMSGDYKTALRFGATMVRIGTALFGERKQG